MGTFNSAQNGNWNTDATWTEAGHPVANDDVVIIAHDITYDVGVSAVAWGNCTINSGGILIFPIAANSKMLFNNTGILTINNGGELRIGTDGYPVAAANLCQIHWPQGVSARYALVLNNGGIISIYGDSAYYGSTIEATLDSAWNAGAGLTLYVEGDYSAKWAAGQHFVIHDYAIYANYQTDAEVFEIDSVGAYDAGNDRTPIVVTAAGDGDTFAIGAGLWMLSRNIELLDPGSSWAIYGFGGYAEKLRFDNNQTTGTDNIMVQDAIMRGWEAACYAGYNFKTENVVFLNCNYVLHTSHKANMVNSLVVSNYIGFYNCQYLSLTGWVIGGYWQIYGTLYSNIVADIIGNHTGLYNVKRIQLDGDVCSCSIGASGAEENIFVGSFKKNSTGLSSPIDCNIFGDLDGNGIGASIPIDIRIMGDIKNNSTGISNPKGACIVQGGVINNNAVGNFSVYSALTDKRRLILENCTVDAVAKELEILANCGSLLCLHNGDGGWQAPDSGSAFILKMQPDSYCDGRGSIGLLELASSVKAMPFGYATTGARVLTFKVYPVGWTDSLTDAELYLEVYYLAGGAGGARTKAVTGTLTMANGAWRNLTVSFTTGQDGIFYYNLILKTYEVGDYVLIDPEWSLS